MEYSYEGIQLPPFAPKNFQSLTVQFVTLQIISTHIILLKTHYWNACPQMEIENDLVEIAGLKFKKAMFYGTQRSSNLHTSLYSQPKFLNYIPGGPVFNFSFASNS